MNDHWPEGLRRYQVEDGRAILLRPRALIPGQRFAFAVAASVIVLGVCGALFDPGARTASALVVVLGVALFALPLSQLFRWLRIERVADGWRITNGLLRWSTSTRTLQDPEIATAMIVDDERGYRNESRPGEHVRISFRSKPFNDAPPAVEVAETFRIPAPELASLRDLLAGDKALK